ncbi:MAG: phage tail tube protein, partial [Pseudomonadota bacterium]
TDASTLTQVGTDSFVGVFYEDDVIVLSGMTNEANNGIQLLITNVAADVLTVAGTPLTIEGADIACTITRLNKVLTYAAGADYTSLEITATNEITSVGTESFVGKIYVSDIIRLDGMSTVANNDLNVRVATVAANVLTVCGNPLTIQGADNACRLSRLKKLILPATPVRVSHTIEQYNEDIDLSELFKGNRLIGARFSFKPGAHATITWTFLGMSRELLVVGTSPWFTTPGVTTGISVVADDSVILKDGVAVTTFTSMDLDFTIAAKGEPTIGNLTSPDVFDNDLSVTGTITALRSDFQNLIDYDAESEFSVAIKLEEPVAAPKPCVSLYLPRVKIGGVDAPLGGDGAQIETRNLLIGSAVATSTLEATPVVIVSSGA